MVFPAFSFTGLTEEHRERVRKRIKDELKTSANDHTDYRAAVGRLQKAYERKCEEVPSASSVAELPPTVAHRSAPCRCTRP